MEGGERSRGICSACPLTASGLSLAGLLPPARLLQFLVTATLHLLRPREERGLALINSRALHHLGGFPASCPHAYKQARV